MKDGYVIKSKANQAVSENDLELINKLTRRKFTAEEVYTFSVVLCDNEIDRDYEKFTDEALLKLEKMFVGKTGILDHDPKSENQTARIFKCFLEAVPGKLNSLGEPYKRLIAKAYMPKCSKNENIILEIDSGIKKEVSVGCSVSKISCSICSKEIKSIPCSHIKGRKYKTEGTEKLCFRILDNPTDAYEWSFVAVPAQREAGVIKSHKNHLKGGEKNMDEIIKSLFPKPKEKISENEIKKALETLKEKAKIGEIYKQELKNDVIKLSNAACPELDMAVMKSICEKISIEELSSLRKTFKTKLSQILPAAPQFTPEKPNLQKNENIQFKI